MAFLQPSWWQWDPGEGDRCVRLGKQEDLTLRWGQDVCSALGLGRMQEVKQGGGREQGLIWGDRLRSVSLALGTQHKGESRGTWRGLVGQQQRRI